MITYCTGSARQKRDYFKETDGVVVLDNVEVIFCVSENGRNYFAYGDVPFGNFSVAEYLDYKRALEKDKVDNALIRSYGISPRKRLKKLSAAEMRIVSFLELTAGKCEKPVVINLDGTEYDRKNAAALSRLLARTADAYVCVTDKRFIEKAKGEIRTLEFGKGARFATPRFYAAKRLAKKIGAKRVAVF